MQDKKTGDRRQETRDRGQKAEFRFHDTGYTMHGVCVGRVSCLEYSVHTEHSRSVDFLKPYFAGFENLDFHYKGIPIDDGTIVPGTNG